MAGVNEFIRRLEKLAAEEVKDRVMRKIADAAHAEAIRGFNEQRDPYGTPWAPRKKPAAWAVLAFGLIDDGHRLLDDSGKMVDSLRARAMSNGAVKMSIRSYAKFHQGGTRYMVARKIFPDPDRGLGTWSDPINKAARDAVSELVNGRSA